MNRLLLVAQYEFFSNLKKPSFLFAAFGMPLFTVGIIVLVTFISASAGGEDTVAAKSVGYVDQAEVLTDPVDVPEGFTAFNSEEAARAALDDSAIDSYFVVPETYRNNGKVELYAYGNIPDDLEDTITDFLARNLVSKLESEAPSERLLDPVNSSIFMENSGRLLPDSVGGVLGLFLVPLAFVTVFMTSLQLTSNFLMSGVVEEKSNRVMEILVTSVSPMQLLGGKLLGLGLLGLLQIVIWGLMAAIGLSLGRDLEFLQSVYIPPDLIVLALVYFIVNYFLYSSLFAGIGAVTGSEQEARQIAAWFSFFGAIPLFFIFQFLTTPNGTVPVVLSLFPFTSAVSIIIRSVFGTIPPEQLIASLTIMVLTAVFITWASAKVFRWSLLMYGKRPSVRELWRVIRGNVDTGTTAASVKES
jgi:ABC-2 type transport system permease protein